MTIPPRLVGGLGVSQLLGWGVSYYLVAIFGEPIAAETGWSRPEVYGGFSAALLVSGLVSPLVGRLMDRHGGRVVMSGGSVLTAIGCVGIAISWDLASYYAAWIVLGAAMRATLYDAAFAALARIGGPAARRPISQITLLGGLASTVLWPVGQALSDAFGWRPAVLCYAGVALLTLPLHLAIPATRFEFGSAHTRSVVRPLATTPRDRMVAGALYAAIVTLTTVLNSAMSAHMIALLQGLGLGAALAVWTASLRGVGQSMARLAEVLFGRRVNPLALGLGAAAVLPLGFGAGLFSGRSTLAALAFALLYGAGNGLLTITRGTQPLVLFDPASYGRDVGRLVAPSFYLAALAPIAFAAVIDRYGAGAALGASVAIACLVVACSAWLWSAFPVTRADSG